MSAANGKDKKPVKPIFTPEELKIIKPILDQKPPIVELSVESLNVDMSYQDRPREKKLWQIVHHFSEALLGVLIISQRPDGTYWVMDGETRRKGLLLRGEKQRLVPCIVLQTSGRRVEALVFAFVNSNRSKEPIKVENVYQAQYIAGTDGGFGKAVEGCGFTFLRGRRQLRGPHYAKDAWNLDGDGTAMKKALYTVKDAWRDKYPVYGYMVLGVSKLYYAFARKAIDEQVRRILQRHSPDQIMEKVTKRYAKIGVKARIHPDEKPALVARELADMINKHPGKAGKIDLGKLAEAEERVGA